MKTLLLVILLMTNGTIEFSYMMNNTVKECEDNIDMAVNWGNSQPGVKGAIAFCTTKLRPTDVITTGVMKI